MEDSSTLMDQRREKLEEIRQLGVDPYRLQIFTDPYNSEKIREQYAEVGDQPDETNIGSRCWSNYDQSAITAKVDLHICKTGAAVSRSMSVKMQSGQKPTRVYRKLGCWRRYWR